MIAGLPLGMFSFAPPSVGNDTGAPVGHVYVSPPSAGNDTGAPVGHAFLSTPSVGSDSGDPAGDVYFSPHRWLMGRIRYRKWARELGHSNGTLRSEHASWDLRRHLEKWGRELQHSKEILRHEHANIDIRRNSWGMSTREKAIEGDLLKW